MAANKEQKSLHAIEEGHVQGVGFRYFVKEKAEDLSLTGWVRNRYDGSVELLTEGEQDRLQLLLEALYVGPSRSVVTNIKLEWDVANNLYSQFSFLPTE